MFEKATREKYRFDSPMGLLTTEDLWDLPLTASKNRASLEGIAQALHRQIRDGSESFVLKVKKADATLQAKFDIVKHIIDVKLAEQETAEKAAENRAKKQRILEIIERKQGMQLEALPLEALLKRVNEL